MQMSWIVSKRLLQLSVLLLCVVASAERSICPRGREAEAPRRQGLCRLGQSIFPGWVSTGGGAGSYIGMSMKGDGSDKREAMGYGSTPKLSTAQRVALVSLRRLRFYDGPIDEWGTPLAYELFAVSEANQWVQLTADPNVHWSGDTSQVASSKDDSFVSFAGWSFTGVGDEVSGGLYTVRLDSTPGRQSRLHRRAGLAPKPIGSTTSWAR